MGSRSRGVSAPLSRGLTEKLSGSGHRVGSRPWFGGMCSGSLGQRKKRSVCILVECEQISLPCPQKGINLGPSHNCPF